MLMNRPLSLAVALVALVASSGCFSPYLKHASGTPEPNPSSVLVAGFVVRVSDGGGNKSVLSAVVDAAQNAGLDEFGKTATGLLAGSFEKFGYRAAYDQARSSKLDAIQVASNAGTAALTGQWRHPDASYWVPQTVDSLFVKPNDIVSKLKTDQKEYFAFTDVTIVDTGMFMKEPTVFVRTAVYDQDARKVLDLGGMGTGQSNFFFSDRSPKNLEKALVQAFESVSAAAEQPL